MLPAANRMRHSAQFSAAVRSGRRVGGRCLVVHHLPGGPECSGRPAEIGFVVSKAVGGSVVRHRVSRRLRAVTSRRLADLPAGSRTVVRALPSSASAGSVQLGEDFDRALRRLAGVR